MVLIHMANLRSTSFDYAGTGSKHFASQQAIMEKVRDMANIQEVRPDDARPEPHMKKVFGGANTHYSNGNQPHLAVDAENMAHSVMRTRTGMLSNPLERAATGSDIEAPTRAKPIPVSLVPKSPSKLPFPAPTRLPLLHKDSRTGAGDLI
jgi:hypothetical protein